MAMRRAPALSALRRVARELRGWTALLIEEVRLWILVPHRLQSPPRITIARDTGLRRDGSPSSGLRTPNPPRFSTCV